MTMFETKPIALAFSFGFSTVMPPPSAIEALSMPSPFCMRGELSTTSNGVSASHFTDGSAGEATRGWTSSRCRGRPAGSVAGVLREQRRVVRA